MSVWVFLSGKGGGRPGGIHIMLMDGWMDGWNLQAVNPKMDCQPTSCLTETGCGARINAIDRTSSGERAVSPIRAPYKPH